MARHKAQNNLRDFFFPLLFLTLMLQSTVKAQAQLVKVPKSRRFVSSGSI